MAVTYCKRGRCLIKINGFPIELVELEILRFKAFEPVLLLGRHHFASVDMRIRVKGGGHTSQIDMRIRIAKALVTFYQKYVDEQSNEEIKEILVRTRKKEPMDIIQLQRQLREHQATMIREVTEALARGGLSSLLILLLVLILQRAMSGQGGI